MQFVNQKQTGDSYTAEEFNNAVSQELQNCVSSTAQAFNPVDDTQLAQSVARVASSINSFTDTGMANSYVLTKNGFVDLPFYTQGMTVIFKATNTNTGPSTVNISGAGSVEILNTNRGQLIGNEIIVDKSIEIIYLDGAFVIINESISDSVLAAALADQTPGSEGSGIVGHTNTTLYNVLPRAFGHVSESAGIYILKNSYNVASIDKIGTGDIQINFTLPMTTVNYSIFSTVQDQFTTIFLSCSPFNSTVNSFRLAIGDDVTLRIDNGFSFTVKEFR